MEIDDRVRDTQSRQIVLDEMRLQDSHRRETRNDRTRRRQGLSSKRRQLKDGPEESLSDPVVLKAKKAAERTERKLAPTPADTKVNEDMIAHLDQLAESIRPIEEHEHEAIPKSDTKKVGEEAQFEGSEAEQEAIKALEDRILGGGFRKRRF